MWLRGSLLLLIVLAAGCASDDPDPGAPPSLNGSGPSSIWLAGLRVETDPNDLDADTQAVKDAVGTAIAVSPVTCFGGIPPEYADGYVLGVAAETREQVEDLVATLGRDPLFIVEVADLCVH